MIYNPPGASCIKTVVTLKSQQAASPSVYLMANRGAANELLPKLLLLGKRSRCLAVTSSLCCMRRVLPRGQAGASDQCLGSMEEKGKKAEPPRF